MFGLHLRAATHIGVHHGAMGDGIDIPHDTCGGLMGELQGVLSEYRGGIPAVAKTSFDVAEGFLFDKSVQMNGEGNGVGQGFEDRQAKLPDQLFPTAQQHCKGVERIDLEVGQKADLLENGVAQVLSFIQQKDRVDAVGSIQGQHPVLNHAEHLGTTKHRLQPEGGTEVGVELVEADGGMAQIQRLVQSAMQAGTELSQDTAFAGAGFAQQKPDAAGLHQQVYGAERLLQ